MSKVNVEGHAIGEVKTISLDLVSAPTKFLLAEPVAVGGNQAFGTVVILLVEDTTSAMEGSGVNGDEEGTAEVGDTR